MLKVALLFWLVAAVVVAGLVGLASLLTPVGAGWGWTLLIALGAGLLIGLPIAVWGVFRLARALSGRNGPS